MDRLTYFNSFDEWWRYARRASRHLFVAAWQVQKAVFVGLASLFIALWRLLSRMVGRYPSVAIAAFLAALYATWLFTFITMRERAVRAEDQRDSISWQYTHFREQHGYEPVSVE